MIAEIRSEIEKFVDAYNRGDASGLTDLYAPDCVDMSAGEATLRGARVVEDTLARLTDTFQKFRGRLTVDTEEIHVAGDWAFDWGTLHLELVPKESGNPVVVERRFIEIWRRQSDGRWKVARSMDNSTGADVRLDFRATLPAER